MDDVPYVRAFQALKFEVALQNEDYRKAYNTFMQNPSALIKELDSQYFLDLYVGLRDSKMAIERNSLVDKVIELNPLHWLEKSDGPLDIPPLRLLQIIHHADMHGGLDFLGKLQEGTSEQIVLQ